MIISINERLISSLFYFIPHPPIDTVKRINGRRLKQNILHITYCSSLRGDRDASKIDKPSMIKQIDKPSMMIKLRNDK